MTPFGGNRLADQRVWVVGASSGIGAAVAREMLVRGARVAISARRREALDEVSGGAMAVVPLDITDAPGVATAHDLVRRALGGLDMVVICAGYWKQFTAAHWDNAEFRRHVEVNLLGTGNVLDAILPEMTGVQRGHVVGIASVAGYRGLSGSEAYAATKAAQINLLESVRASLAHKGVRVTTVCPGFVRTEMTGANTFPMPFIVEAAEAATSICDGLERGQQEIVFPWQMALLMKTVRALPVRVWTAISARAAR